MSKRIYTILTLSTAAILPQSALAKEQIIVSATGVEQSVDASGASISVLDSSDILAQQTVQLSDILAELPGVQVARSGNLGGQTSVRIRGAEADQTLVLINGIRVNDPSSPDGSFDFAHLFAGNVERVEVLRGANSVAWGSQAIGGVVLAETVRPTDRFKAFGSAEYGSHDIVNLSGNVSGSVGPVGLALGGGWFETDGISAFSGGTEKDGYERASANGRLTFAITPEVGFELSGFYSDSRVENDNVFPGFSSDSTVAQSDSEEIYGRGALTARLFDGSFANELAFSVADINRDIIGDFFTSAPRGRTERFEYRGDWRVADMVRLVFGAETEETYYRDNALNAESGIDSFYAQAIVQPMAGLTLTGGVRQDEHEDFGGNSSFAADLAWAFAGADGPILRAGYREGFRAPSLIDLSPDPALSGNPELRPETARFYEIGLADSWLDGAWTGGITFFQRDSRDQISFVSCLDITDLPQVCIDRLADYDPSDPFAFPPGTTFNIEKTRVRGFELESSMMPMEGFRVTANYTYLDTENRSANTSFGNELARRASHSLYAEATWQSDFGLDLAADILLAGDSFDDVANSRPIDGYELVGVRAAYRLNDAIELFGRVENLFDTDYEVATDFGSYGRTAYIGLRGRY